MNEINDLMGRSYGTPDGIDEVHSWCISIYLNICEYIIYIYMCVHIMYNHRCVICIMRCVICIMRLIHKNT